MTEARLVPLYRGGIGQSPPMSAAHWRDQGKVQQAHELLAPVYGWFTEGFGTREVLLEELAS